MRLFLGIFLLLESVAAFAQTGVTDDVRANLRSGRAEYYRIIKVLPPQTQVEVLTTEGDYTRVKTAEGQEGWMLSKLLTVQEAADKAGNQDLEDAQNQLHTTQAELAKVQGELEQERSRTGGRPPLTTLIWVGLGALAAGIALGVLILQAYYRRRLHGLRI